MTMSHQAASKPIRTEADAVAWLKSADLYDGLKIVERKDKSYVIKSAACGRCGGRGYGGWYPDGGICYDCNGANTVNSVRAIHIKVYSQKAKARARAQALSAERAREAAVESKKRMLDGQRNWCEANGHGRVTFEERDAAIKAAKPTSGHVGEVGKRAEYTATIKAIPSWDGHYGVTYCHIMTDADGNIIIWKTASGFDNAGKGDTVRFKATVKEHTERDGEKQTIVTRAKEIAVETAKEAA